MAATPLEAIHDNKSWDATAAAFLVPMDRTRRYRAARADPSVFVAVPMRTEPRFVLMLARPKAPPSRD